MIEAQWVTVGDTINLSVFVPGTNEFEIRTMTVRHIESYTVGGANKFTLYVFYNVNGECYTAHHDELLAIVGEGPYD